MGDLRGEVARQTRELLRGEARRLELRIAYVRVVVVGSMAAMLWLLHWFPSAISLHADDLKTAVAALYPSAWFHTAWFAVALAIALPLRAGRHHAALSFVVPLVDAVAVSGSGWLLRRMVGQELFVRTGVLSSIGMAAAMLAVFGGLRLSRTAAAFSTGLAIAIYVPFAISSAGYVEVSVIAAGAVILVGIGVLDWWIIDVVRRAAAGDLARASLKRFLPSHLISGAYSDPAALLEPRMGDATVLFTDLRGFTAMTESLAPANVLALVNELHGELVQIVRAHGGVIDKFTGDGMLAVFGALQPENDHADRALAVARGLRGAMKQLNRARAEREQPPLRIGIGLHSGPIVAGCVGSEDRLEFTVLGDTVNTAARIEALTKEHGVDLLVTSETWSRLREREGLVDCGEAQLRGRKQPLRVFSLPA